MLRVLSSAIEPAVRFLQTLPTGCLQQDVVNKNSTFKIKSGGLLICLGAGATCIHVIINFRLRFFYLHGCFSIFFVSYFNLLLMNS